MNDNREIVEVLFPKARAAIIRLLFSTPPKHFYVRELARLSGLTLRPVQDELRKLNAIGLVTSWSDRYHRFYRANRNHPLHSHLLGIAKISGRLPRANRSALARPPSRGRKRNRRRNLRRPLANRPPSWGLFTSRAQKLDGSKPSSLQVVKS